MSSIPKPTYRKNPNEYGLLAWQYIEGLKLLTLRQELQTLIIPAEASKFLPEVAGGDAARNLRAWCPACFYEWRTSDQPLYEPLLWSLSIVTTCPIHHKLLQLRCPHCQKSQLPLTARTLVARCSQCFAWLDAYPNAEAESAEIAMETERDIALAEKVLRAFSSWQISAREDTEQT